MGAYRSVQRRSCLINADGSVAAIDAGDGVAFADFDIEWTRSRTILANRSLLAGRAPE